jgi:hypothetical protein
MLKKRIGVANQTAWAMNHNIRHAMGSMDRGYKMGRVLEMNESFFGSPAVGGKRWRSTDKAAVSVSVLYSGGGNPEHAKLKSVNKVSS